MCAGDSMADGHELRLRHKEAKERNEQRRRRRWTSAWSGSGRKGQA